MANISRLKYVLAVVGLLSVAIIELTLFFKFSSGPWTDKLGLIFKMLAFYGVGYGFLARSEALGGFKESLDEMTSSDPFRCIRGNFIALGMMFGILAIGFSPRKRGLSPLGGLLLLPLAPFVFFYSIFHMTVLLPLAYVAYLVPSGLVNSFMASNEDTIWTLISAEQPTQIASTLEIVKANPVAAKSFLMGIPVALLSLGEKAFALFGLS